MSSVDAESSNQAEEGNPNVDRSTALVSEEDLSPEFLQRKLYFLLEQLKLMHQALPENYQMRISFELLTVLANSLLNDTIFEIVKGLMEIQHVTEKHLQQIRHQVENQYQIEVQEWMSKIQDQEELGHILGLMKIKHTKKLMETDLKLIAHLDQKNLAEFINAELQSDCSIQQLEVCSRIPELGCSTANMNSVRDQQSTLETAGVPGFYVTDNPKEIMIQMHLLDFILRLSRMKFESNK